MADMRGSSNTNTLSAGANDSMRALAVDRLGGLFTSDVKGMATRAAMAGRLICAGPAANGTLITGQISYVATTPTFALNVPSGSLAVPVELVLQQAGTVAGGAISVYIEVSSSVGVYASGGAVEKQVALYAGSGFSTSCVFYSGPTTTAGYGISIASWLRGMDVVSAEGAPTEIVWRPDVPIFLLGPVALKIYTVAGTTGASWAWSFKYADLPTGVLT